MADARATSLNVLVGTTSPGDARTTQLEVLVGTKSLGDNRVTQLHLLVGAAYVQATATPPPAAAVARAWILKG